MIKTIPILPGVTLRCFPDGRFKQSCLSLQFVRPMCREEAACNALIPSVLLRGCRTAPDLRDITLRLDDLYGAAVGAVVRRIGDYQTTGLHCNFIEDQFALDGESVLADMVEFLGQLLIEPVLENGVFRRDYVESEKKNLITTIDSQRNNKRAYASAQLLRRMCEGDSFGIPRLGESEQVKEITTTQAYAHYQKLLASAPVEIFYVGSARPEQVAALIRPLFEKIDGCREELPGQTPLSSPEGGQQEERMEVAQGKLAMGFVTPITITDQEFAAMQLLNTLFGGGMTSKLFVNIREKNSLCYDISSSYHSVKGIITVGAGIDCDKKETVEAQILEQLEDCRQGRFSDGELQAAREAVLSSLRGVHDSPGAIENYYAVGALSGLGRTPEEYSRQIRDVTREQVAQAAKSMKLHTTYFLRGEQA